MRLLAAVLMIWTFVFVSSPPAAAYNRGLTRHGAKSYAQRGLWEDYDLGGGTFRDNDKIDADEGIDCSAYVEKAWGIPNSSPTMQFEHEYYTGEYYPTRPGERGRDRHTNALTQWVGEATKPVWDGSRPENPYWMESFVYRYTTSSGGAGGHMGFFIREVRKGVWETWEAMDSRLNVRTNTRSLSELQQKKWHNVDRLHWDNRSWYCDQNTDC